MKIGKLPVTPVILSAMLALSMGVGGYVVVQSLSAPEQAERQMQQQKDIVKQQKQQKDMERVVENEYQRRLREKCEQTGGEGCPILVKNHPASPAPQPVTQKQRKNTYSYND